MRLDLSLLVSLTLVSAVGCDNGTAAANVDYAPLLAQLTDAVVMPANQAFVTDATALDMALATLSATPTATTLSAAQAAWRTARASFRRLDALHFGPVSDDGISERIDLPPANTSGIDSLIGGTMPIDVTLVGMLGGNSKGFLGIEYLLFDAAGGSDGNNAVLARLTEATAGARRCLFAQAMGDEIVASATQLATAWDPTQGGYATLVKTAGAGSSRYPRQRGALDDFVGGVTYAFEEVVGNRLAAALGKSTLADPSANLTPRSDSVVADMNASLDGIAAAYDGMGFEARVRLMSAALDETAVSEHMACVAAVTAIPSPFATTVVDQTTVVSDAYTACKAWKFTWNTSVTSALGATVRPSDVDGD